MSATTNLGKVSVTPKGAWAITNTYEILDIVTSGGSSYLAKQDVPTGVPLSNTSYWIMIAEKGDGGEVTSASASISGGYGTPGVSVTAGGTAHERTLAFAFTNLRGEKGETGNGIDSVYKTGTSGLVDTYTILFTDGSTYEFEVNNGTASIDNTLTKSGWAADAKVVGDTKASIDGFYETMGVGVADNLTPYSEDSGATQDIPFIAQGTGCGNGESVVDTGSYLQFKKKLGNTVGVNQLVPDANTHIVSSASNAWGNIGDFFFSLIAGHTYRIALIGKTVSNGYNGEVGGGKIRIRDVTEGIVGNLENGTNYNGYYTASKTTNGTTLIQGYWAEGDTDAYLKISDLTLWYGSPDRIPSDLLSHPENWGRYYAGSLDYNAGTLESADGSILTSIHRNIWDEEWEIGNYDTNGAPNPSGNNIRSKNYIDVIPNNDYYFFSPNNLGVYWYDDNKTYISMVYTSAGSRIKTVPSNARFMRFYAATTYGTTYNHDITISLYYPGESGYDQYYPYSVLAEADTGSEVLRSAGSVADEKTPDGTITRRVGVVDLGTLTWTRDTSGTYPTFWASVTGMRGTDAVAMCSKYTYGGSEGWATVINGNYEKKVVTSQTTSTPYVMIQDSAYSDAATFKTAMSGIYLYYELATPTTEQGTAFAENIPCDDFGSMYWTQTKGIPQGNEIFYPVDYKASIDTLYNRVEGDMGAIVIDSQLEVVADRIPEAPSEDGTYTLKATVSSGTKTYSWVADE